MNDEQKPEDSGETREQPAQVTEPPTPEPHGAAATTPRTRRILLTSGAGIALASGLVGFGIGHASADHDGDHFQRISQYAPGEGRPGDRDRQRPDFRDGEQPGIPSNGTDDGGQPGDGNQPQSENNDPT